MKIGVVAPASRITPELAGRGAHAGRDALSRPRRARFPSAMLRKLRPFRRTMTMRAPTPFSTSPTIPASTRSGSRAAAMARGASQNASAPIFGIGRAEQNLSRLQRSRLLLAGLYRGGLHERRARAHAGRSQPRRRRKGRRARAALSDRARARYDRAACLGGALRGLQHHHAQPSSRHAAGAGSERPRADARGSVRASLPHRPRAASHHLHPDIRRVAGIRLGRCSRSRQTIRISANEEEIARHWCEVSGIPYLGRADIGHDVDNKVVPVRSCRDGVTAMRPPMVRSGPHRR